MIEKQIVYSKQAQIKLKSEFAPRVLQFRGFECYGLLTSGMNV
jgi:hypothetical protein